MISACLISMPPEALERIAARGAQRGCGGRHTERRIALWVFGIAMMAGVLGASFT